MSKLAQERNAFIVLLHDVFIRRTGHGAFAYISITQALELFEQFLATDEAAVSFINRFVRSV